MLLSVTSAGFRIGNACIDDQRRRRDRPTGRNAVAVVREAGARNDHGGAGRCICQSVCGRRLRDRRRKTSIPQKTSICAMLYPPVSGSPLPGERTNCIPKRFAGQRCVPTRLRFQHCRNARRDSARLHPVQHKCAGCRVEPAGQTVCLGAIESCTSSNRVRFIPLTNRQTPARGVRRRALSPFIVPPPAPSLKVAFVTIDD